MTIKIKDFKTNIECSTKVEARNILSNDFRGKDVSILIKRDSGCDKLVFITVNLNGEIYETYTGNIINIFSI